uniref:Soluble scavenger receptor cysteine-rich domain-containing protein SSC5D n=1 Tax=Latimeria chalumnae TaxID=7897 RepID=H3A2K9_LATCH
APRLVGGADARSGRVEIQYGETWGAVCDRNWDIHDADVVCRQLKCGFAVSAPGGATFGEGAGPIWGDRVDCQGNESILWECPFTPQGPQNCTHKNDAAVICSGHGGRRLVDEESRCSGRLEILHENIWGSVCDQYLDLEDASVICKHLSCGVAVSVGGAHFGKGDGLMWRDSFHCGGNESHVWKCPTTWDQPSCTSNKTAGVICSESCVTESLHYSLKIVSTEKRHLISITTLNTNSVEFKELKPVSDRHDCAGRVEVFYNGTWGSVCSNNMRDVTIGVICQQMGCGNTGTLDKQFGEEGSGLKWLDSISCFGYESVFWQCPPLPWGQNKCIQGEVAQIACQEKDTIINFPCTGETGACEGTVEVYSEGRWGTVCSNIPDAEVVCKKLGCGSAVLAPLGNTQVGAFLLNNVHCHGNESHLWQCESDHRDREDCKSESDALIVCSGKVIDLEIRIVESPSPCHGAVQVYYRGVWGSVCSQSGNLKDAAVVCKQLGSGEPEAAPSSYRYNHTEIPIWLNRVQCTENESSLWECQAETLGHHECNHWMDAGVSCKE